MARVFYFISDLHIGGDEALGVCDFEDELVRFLEDLASREDEELELLSDGPSETIVDDCDDANNFVNPGATESCDGYDTAAFVGNWTLKNKLSGLGEHFDEYESLLTRRTSVSLRCPS